MPSDGGVSRQEVNSIVSRELSPVKNHVNAVQSKVEDVERRLGRFAEQTNQQIQNLKQSINELERDIMTLSTNFEALISRLDSKMASFEQAIQMGNQAIVNTIQSSNQETRDSVRQTTKAVEVVSKNVVNLEEESRRNTTQVIGKLDESDKATRKGLGEINQGVEVVARETKAGTQEITRQIDRGTASTSTGLKKVSSSVALQEFLEGQFMVSEATLSIRNTQQQIENRFDQAQRNVEKIQALYDDHFQRTINGFYGDLEVISSHIKELEEKAFKNLESISFDFKLDFDRFDRVVSAEQKRINQRNNAIQAEYEKLDLNELARFKELYKEMLRFVSDPSLLHFEYDSETELQGIEGGGFYLPVLLVQMEASDEVEIYCMNAMGTHTSEAIELPSPLKTTEHQVRKFCYALNPSPGEYISREAQAELLEAMKRLKERRLIDDGDYELIEQHMATHRLKAIELADANCS